MPTTKTIGKALSELLQANGVPGSVVYVEGGPLTLRVYYRQPDNTEASVDLDLSDDAKPVQLEAAK